TLGGKHKTSSNQYLEFTLNKLKNKTLRGVSV
ncbi:MAG: hypothetical protein ACI9EH_000182, partial [Planktomarina sp.]